MANICVLTTVIRGGVAGGTVSLAFAWGGAELGTLCVWMLSLTSNGEAFMPSGARCGGMGGLNTNAEGLLCLEKAQFHRVGSISDHFVRRLLAAFFLNAMS